MFPSSVVEKRTSAITLRALRHAQLLPTYAFLTGAGVRCIGLVLPGLAIVSGRRPPTSPTAAQLVGALTSLQVLVNNVSGKHIQPCRPPP